MRNNRGFMMRIPFKVKAECVQMKKDGKKLSEIHEFLKKEVPTSEMTEESLKRLLNKWRNKVTTDEKILQGGNLLEQYDIRNATVQVNKKGEPIQAWLKGQKNNDLWERLVKAVESRKPITEPDATIYLPTKEIKGGLLELSLYDMHFGISTLEYYMQTLEDVNRIIERKWDTILITIGSDMFHNDNFRGQTANGTQIEEVDMEKAWDDAETFYTSILYNAIRNSRNVHVKYIKGNHDESISWAFTKNLESLFQHSVTFDTEMKQRKSYKWEKIFIGFSHGDKSAKDIDRKFIFNHPMEWAESVIHEIHLGHFHKEQVIDEYDEHGTMIRILSTKNKTDRWHDDNGYVGANKRFTVFEYGTDCVKGMYYV